MKLDRNDPASQPERAKTARSRFYFLSIMTRVAVGFVLLLPATVLIAGALCLITVVQSLLTLLMFVTGHKPPPPPSDELPSPAMWLRDLAAIRPTASA